MAGGGSGLAGGSVCVGHPGGVWGQRCLQPGGNGRKMMLGSGDMSPLSPSTAQGLSPSSSSPSWCRMIYVQLSGLPPVGSTGRGFPARCAGL